MNKIIKSIVWKCPYCLTAHIDSYVRCRGCGTKRSTRFDINQDGSTVGCIIKHQIGRFNNDNSVKWLAAVDTTSTQDESLWRWCANRDEALPLDYATACQLYGYTKYPVSTFLIKVGEVLS